MVIKSLSRGKAYSVHAQQRIIILNINTIVFILFILQPTSQNKLKIDQNSISNFFITMHYLIIHCLIDNKMFYLGDGLMTYNSNGLRHSAPFVQTSSRHKVVFTNTLTHKLDRSSNPSFFKLAQVNRKKEILKETDSVVLRYL